jgi:hypothetical protein
VAPRASYLTYPNYLRKHKAQSQQKLPSLLSQEIYKNKKFQDWTPTEKENPQRKTPQKTLSWLPEQATSPTQTT